MKEQGALHIPVMATEILEGLRESLQKSPQPKYFDGTLGRGGHLKVFLDAFPNLKAVATDRDPEAIEYAKKFFEREVFEGRLQLVHANFSEYDFVGNECFDAALLDLGVSSPQLDEGRRGFSFMNEGPLDMRMNPLVGESAADVIANYDEEDLISIFKKYGEVFKPYRVVRAIIHDRKEKTFASTRDLAGLIERVDGWRKKGFHPATQYFMALRLFVNQELQSIEDAVPRLIEHGLKSTGRLAVLTFHSLEDRIIKNLFRESLVGYPVNKKVIEASEQELELNSRSRSAKLRFFQKGQKLEEPYFNRGPKGS